jgi:hypothetical protein
MEELFGKIMEFIGSASAQAGIIAVMLEFFFRLLPTKKPLGLLILIGDASEMLGKALIAFSSLLDKVLPQKIKEE